MKKQKQSHYQSQRVRIVTRVPVSLHANLKRMAAEHGVSLAELLRRALNSQTTV